MKKLNILTYCFLILLIAVGGYAAYSDFSAIRINATIDDSYLIYGNNSAGTNKISVDTSGNIVNAGNITATGAVSAAGITSTGGITANVLQSAEHGAGAIGTAFAPRTYRWTENGHIITEIHVDLTGLACKGDVANDVIGLAAGGAAYIGRYVTATYGILYKAEVYCVETPGEGTATITTDIDIAFNSSAVLAYDGAAGAAELNLGGVAAGNTYQDLTLALTANDYIYLVEGDTAATTGVYNAGQLIIRLYGHAVIS